MKSQPRTLLSSEIHKTYRLLAGTLLLLSIALTSTYLFLNTLKPAKGYELEKLQNEYEELQSDLRKLNQKITDAQSFETIESSDSLDSMDRSSAATIFTGSSTYAQNGNFNASRITE